MLSLYLKAVLLKLNHILFNLIVSDIDIPVLHFYKFGINSLCFSDICLQISEEKKSTYLHITWNTWKNIYSRFCPTWIKTLREKESNCVSRMSETTFPPFSPIFYFSKSPLRYIDLHNNPLLYIQRSKAGSRQNECFFLFFLVRQTWFPCFQLYMKVWMYRLIMYSCKFKSIFLLAIFQKEDPFEITWIHVSEIIHFSVCNFI